MRGALFRFADVGVVAGGRDLLRDLTVDVRSGGVTGITGAVGGRQDHDAPAVQPARDPSLGRVLYRPFRVQLGSTPPMLRRRVPRKYLLTDLGCCLWAVEDLNL
jgi:ABC-type sugar transport system ATPase subunit